MPRTVPEIADLVRAGLSTLDATPFASLIAAGAVYEVPFLGHRIEGRDAVVATLLAGGVRARAAGLTEAQVTTTLTDSGFVVELVVSGPGVEFPSSVGILTVSNGEITSYRDYPDTSAASRFTRSVFDRFLAASVENRWDDLADLYAEDVTLEMPFTLPGMPSVTKGREELRRRFRAAGESRRITKADNVVVHETTDPSVLVAEFDLHQEVRGTTFAASYVMVLTVQNGLITHSRDYTDTAAAAERIKAWSPAGSTAG
ncbi:nuclear transport factor 2 family protein [Amycolatopsis sp. DG1A-15b]|uniref:nuclear transport factor 2 family protein n=1 Tax=Amycolatopsis sp. DG1A-15b TaxID=3052846 RepID=UPI00255B72EA|nr:nuclear transport factor 2 family protein [Amycolatopsis sp. DG1A-15b]WIX87105.1 nuclear transport factor 2 family protein [Amycolatopsis sp. DG1A-15b]